MFSPIQKKRVKDTYTKASEFDISPLSTRDSDAVDGRQRWFGSREYMQE